MNLDRYEKIDGREAFRRLFDGESVFMELPNETVKLKLSKDGLWCEVAGYENQATYWTFNQIYTSKGLYIPKPFDVRQAMLDRPNEWVGAFKDDIGRWWKFGFEERSFEAVAIPFAVNTKLPLLDAYRATGDFYPVSNEVFENCIPIEDVPEEATR